MTTATISYLPVNDTTSVADLLPEVSDGDPAAWNEIIRRYGKLVSTTVRLYRLQEADAHDAMQMTWLRLAENADQVQFPERLSGWLATTARRECLRILRQRKLGANYSDPATETFPDPSAGPEQQAVDGQITQLLWKLTDELSPLQRTLIRLLFTDNPCSYDKISRITGIPLGGIGPTRVRALRQLRNKLDDHQVGPRT